jgi:TnpA family transposase
MKSKIEAWVKENKIVVFHNDGENSRNALDFIEVLNIESLKIDV